MSSDPGGPAEACEPTRRAGSQGAPIGLIGTALLPCSTERKEAPSGCLPGLVGYIGRAPYRPVPASIDGRFAVQQPLTRDFTATTFVVSDDRTLLLWHNKIQAWLPPGGHITEGELPEEAALREVREEVGLEVDLLNPPAGPWGHVRVLHTPVCILLVDFEPGHQHIDLIYFARSPLQQVQLNSREASAHRWCSGTDLDSPDIAEDIRVLGLRALAAAASAESAGS